MKTHLTIAMLLLLLASTLYAQTGARDLEAETDAYCQSDLEQWEGLIDRYQSVYEKSRSPEDGLLLAKARFGAVGACFAHQEEKQAKTWLKAAEKDLKDLLASRGDWAEAHALLGGVYGMQIALSPMKGMFLGPKSNRHIEQALSMEPDNALAHYQRGSSLYNTPAMFGGDVEKAIQHLERARILCEQQSAGYNWEYLNTLAMLGQAYHYQDRYQDALRVYEEALRIAPAFGWVKNVLLPELEADM